MTKYGLIGCPLGHSFSSEYFNNKFSAEGIDAEYNNYEIGEIGTVVSLISQPELRGLNVTSPYKEQVVSYLSCLTETAAAIGAVNTIKIERIEDGRVTSIGHNTDVEGFDELLTANMPADFRPPRSGSGQFPQALVLGYGGAAHAVVYALRKKGIEPMIVSRSRSDNPGIMTYADIDSAILAHTDLIVQATPLGMGAHKGECPPLQYDAILPHTLCLDLIYNPARTEFMRRCENRGCRTANGLQMLIGQARAAWKFWNS